MDAVVCGLNADENTSKASRESREIVLIRSINEIYDIKDKQKAMLLKVSFKLDKNSQNAQ
jgi:hypothetical protein